MSDDKPMTVGDVVKQLAQFPTHYKIKFESVTYYNVYDFEEDENQTHQGWSVINPDIFEVIDDKENSQVKIFIGEIDFTEIGGSE